MEIVAQPLFDREPCLMKSFQSGLRFNEESVAGLGGIRVAGHHRKSRRDSNSIKHAAQYARHVHFVQLLAEPVANTAETAHETNPGATSQPSHDCKDILELIPLEAASGGQQHGVALHQVQYMRDLRPLEIAVACFVHGQELQKMRTDRERRTLVSVKGK